MQQPILLLLVLCNNFSSSNAWEDPLVEWLRSKNGFFSEEISWQQLDPNDPTSPYSMFASKDIKKDETLIVVPPSTLITSGGTEMNCDTVTLLLEELEKGKDSDYYPYINSLFGDKTKRGKLPAEWSELGKILLKELVGESLQPEVFDHHSVADYCAYIVNDTENVSQLEQDAYLYMISRSWDDVMIPVFDMINHRNGKWRNVEHTSAHMGEDIRVFALRDIKAGEQLHISYNECNDEDCHGLKYVYLTPSILNDYGFVEQYPRRFRLEEDNRLVAEIDIDETTGEKFLTWPLKKYPNTEQLNYIHAQLKRLRDLDDIISKGAAKLESVHERDVITEYHRALKEVMELAIAYREDGIPSKNQSSATDTATAKQYDSLSEAKGAGLDGENIEVCWDNPFDRSWHTIDKSKSQYQTIEFTYNEDTDNTCLQLSGWLQTCTNFRPHYHEAFVHVPAQYVDDVKRVVFLGGGDNMILHEILKYPNLELVVGMELDQQVIRSSFKNIGTLPYFDDHRVHWWFGDATKSLLALPESYYGSFDLVLVDLQTFVADALKVTDKLTIMETATLLMKQDGGVIAKNEDFIIRTNTGFAKYTVDLEYHDLPHICQQSITMGSNSIDFIKASPKDHSIETKAIDLAGSDSANPYHAWYNYRQTFRDTCKKNDLNDNASSKTSDQRGVLVILEVENVSRSLEPITEVQATISAAVKEMGLTEVAVSTGKEDNSFIFVMNEGYITVRLFAEEKYIAFDVLLWNSLDIVDIVNEALIKAVGGNSQKSSSSFRFVTGGMYGLESTQRYILAQIAADTEKSLCQGDASNVGSADTVSANQNDATLIFHELISSLIPLRKDRSASVVGILCGDKTSECSSLEIANRIESIKVAIVPIYACNPIGDMSICEKETEKSLIAAVKQHKKLDAIVMDANLPFEMGQIVESIFSNKVTHHKIMEGSQLILTPVVKGENWRNVLIDRFRTDMVLFDPAYRADLRFSEAKPGKKVFSSKWSLFSSGDQAFFNRFSSALSIIKEKTNIDAEVEEVANGIVNFDIDFSPPKVFMDSDYDKTRSKAQWSTQKPMGHQTIFHMHVQPPKTRLDEGEPVLVEHQPGPWDIKYGKAVVQKYLGNEVYSVLDDRKKMPEPISRSQIRKFSDADKDLSIAFEVGDLIFYQTDRGIYRNGVISRAEDDGTFSIYLLNTSGTKLYGVQKNRLMYQYESADFYQEIPALSTSTLLGAFEKALKSNVVDESEGISPIESISIGTGVVMTAFWNEGHAILKWDGLKRVDVNLFTYKEDKDIRLVFQDAFCGQIDFMVGVSRDEHPRGYGGIVNFKSEIETPPNWV